MNRQIPNRYRLADTRLATNHTFIIDGHKCYIQFGLFADGQPGEMFLHINKEGSTLSGFAEMFAILVSMLLQSGWTVEMLAKKLKNQQFEPRGLITLPSGNPSVIKEAESIVDYIFKFMELTFKPNEQRPIENPTSETIPGGDSQPTIQRASEADQGNPATAA